jgi:hypothetical protein
MKSLSIVFVIFIVSCAVSCGSEYPDEPSGGKVSGRVFYDGTAHLEVARPAVGVYAYTKLPDITGKEVTLPHVSHLYLDPVFGEDGLSYELEFLEAYEYVILVTLFDLDRPPTEPLGFGLRVGVEVTAEEPTTGIDITVVDSPF